MPGSRSSWLDRQTRKTEPRKTRNHTKSPSVSCDFGFIGKDRSLQKRAYSVSLGRPLSCAFDDQGMHEDFIFGLLVGLVNVNAAERLASAIQYADQRVFAHRDSAGGVVMFTCAKLGAARKDYLALVTGELDTDDPDELEVPQMPDHRRQANERRTQVLMDQAFFHKGRCAQAPQKPRSTSSLNSYVYVW